MSVTKDVTVAEEGTALALPPRLLAPFEAAQRALRSAYGFAPDVPSLIRLWLACATDSRVRREFEAAVLQINENVIPFDHGTEFDGDAR